MREPIKPAVELYGYQKRWISDPSRFKLAVKSVQIGWSWAAALEVALDMLPARTTWLWMSGSQRQSREAAEYCKVHLRAMKATAELAYNVEEFFGDTKMLVDRVTMPNGSRAFFLPANPETARGFAGNVVLDEYASQLNPRAIWAAMFGRVSRGYKLRVFSSPKGDQGKFYDLAKMLGLADGITPRKQPVAKDGWSGHWCDIHQAITEGCPVNADELRLGMADDDLFAQEYLCVFLSAEKQWIPSDLIEAAVSAEATTELPAAFRPRGPLWMGMDVGRTRDLTVHALLEQTADVFTVRALDTQRKAKFSQQRQRAEQYLPLVRRCRLDATGLGMQNAEELQEKYPAKVEPVEFNLESKSEMAVWMKRRFEDHTLRIPDNPETIADIKAVKRIITDAGNVRFDARRTDAGHADRFWAIALAGTASDQACEPMSDGILAGPGLMSQAAIDHAISGAPAPSNWFLPSHADDHGRRMGRSF